MFRIEMLPAARGDCLWIEYGNSSLLYRVLIDGGITSTATKLRARIEQLPVSARRFELLVVTHIDMDHIAGILKLLEDPPEGLAVGDVWFNGWKHLPNDSELLSVEQGERLTELLTKHDLPWNRAFAGEAVMISGEESGLPEKTLPGGMRLTLLSPTSERLRRLRTVWKKEVEGEKPHDRLGHPDERKGRLPVLGGPDPDLDRLAKSPFKADDSQANGSSIAFIATYDGKRCLFTGDAFASDIQSAVERIAREEGERRLSLDALKLAHHGGQKNTSADLVSTLDCARYLFSTNGTVYGHPDQESVARVVVHSCRQRLPHLFFNYRSQQNRVWDKRTLFRGRYEPVYPDLGQEGMAIDL